MSTVILPLLLIRRFFHAQQGRVQFVVEPYQVFDAPSGIRGRVLIRDFDHLLHRVAERERVS